MPNTSAGSNGGGKREVNAWLEEHELHEDDGIEKRSAVVNDAGIWTKCIIPYTFDENLPQSNRDSILEQQQVLQKETGFRFVPFNNSNAQLQLDHDNYLVFHKGSGCNCPRGNKRGNGQWCSACTGSTVIHELGHAFGMGHEQNHPASFPYLDSNYDAMSNTWVYSRWHLTQMHLEDKVYDPSSVMHYADWAFKKDYRPTVSMMDPDFNYLVGSRNYYYLFKAIQEYNKCYDEFLSCSPLPECDFDGYPSVIDGECKCRCPEGLDPSSGCTTPVPKEMPPSNWPTGKYSFLKSTVSPCPAGFETGTMYNYPAYYSWDGGDYHFEVHDGYELAHKTCTHTDGASGGYSWPAGSYCILRYNGTCPEGFNEGKAETWGKTPDKQDEGTVPDGEHGQFFEYIFCCRSDGESSVPITLPTQGSFILYRSKGNKCQEIKGMTWKQEIYYIRSNVDERMVYRTGELPHIYVYSSYTQYVYYCVYFTVAVTECDEVKTLAENEVDFTFTTPNFPANYPVSTSCMWHIKSPEGTTMQLDFEEFEVSYSTDKSCKSSVTLKAYRPGMPGFKFCGHNYEKTHWTVTNYLTVKFVSGTDDPWKGFKARVKVLKDEDKCYKGDGRDRSYAEPLSYSKTFAHCLPWNQVSHCYFHQFDSRYVDYDLSNNYCRNIGVANQPWCYTNSDFCTRQFCDACLTGSCFDLFEDCAALISDDQDYCTKNLHGEAARGCKKSCGICDNHVPKGPATCGPPPDVKGIQATPVLASYNVGDVVTYQCPSGSDSRESVCTSQGTWTNMNFVCGACPSGWTVRDKRCYKYMGWDVSLDHAAATSACAAYGGHLIQADSNEKQKVLNDLSDYYPETVTLTWVGLTKDSNNQWVWPDGSALSWSNWYSGQPSSDESKTCVTTDYGGKWYNEPCTNRYNVICEYTPTGPFSCEDQLDNCAEILQGSPEICSKYPDYAWANCRLTCGVGECNQGVTCTNYGNSGNSTIRTAGSDTISVGQFVSYKCADNYVQISGDLSRACLPSGSLTGSALECSESGNEVTLFSESQLYQRSSLFAADDTYINDNPQLIFPYDGNVTAWTFYSHNDEGQIAFQIFRPLADPTQTQTLTFVGENVISPLPTQRIYTYHVPESSQVSVQKGDIIGLYVKGKELSYTSCSGSSNPESNGWMYTSSSTKPGQMVAGETYSFIKSTWASCRIFTVRPTLRLT